jgi:hypothetical protein
MALLKVSEFAKLYNLNRTNIYTYQKRGKLIIVEGYVDDSNPINAIFIKSRETSNRVKARRGEKKEYETTIPKPESIEDTEVYKKTKDKTNKILSNKSNDTILSDYTRTNQLKEQKLEEEIRLQKLKTDVFEKKLIPVAAIDRTVSEILNRYRVAFLQQTEQLLRDTLNELIAGNEKITYTCSKLTDIANESTKRAANETRAIIKTIINESADNI